MSENEKQKKARPSALKRIGITFLILIAALMSISLIVQIPAVQKWGVRHITQYLSKETGSKVDVGGFSINILSEFKLRDVYVSQYQMPSDTLLYAGEVGMRFTKLWKLFTDQPDINRLSLHHARLLIGDTPIRLFEGSQKTNKKRGIHLKDPVIVLDDVYVQVDQSASDVAMTYYLPGGTVNIAKVNTEDAILDVRSVDLRGPQVELRHREGVPDTIVVSRDTIVIDSSQATRKQWEFSVGSVQIHDGSFHFIDPLSKAPPTTALDYQNLSVSDLQADLADVSVVDGIVSGEIRDIHFEEASGLRFDKIAAKHFVVTSDEMSFGGLTVNTTHSTIADSVFIKRLDPNESDDKFEIYAHFDNAEIAVADLLRTIPGLKEGEVFRTNADDIIHISGIVRGSPNRLRGDSLNVQLGAMTFAGQFRSRNLTQPGKQVLNLVVDQARFTPFDLEDHIPGIHVQDQFRTLGVIQFQGKFDGFLSDFVAYGKVSTAIGKAEVDMNLVTRGERAEYSGSIKLDRFNLKKWTGIDDFGLISARLQLKDGTGLTAETASAKISGTVNEFQYKGYTYKDVRVDGKLDQNQFDGLMEIHDPNIDLVFQGNVRRNGQIPVYDFSAQIAHLDLKSLNLVRDTFIVSGAIDAQGEGRDFNSLMGSIQASALQIRQAGNMQYALDTLLFDIENIGNGERYLHTKSDYMNGWVKGVFDFNTLYPTVARYLEETYPQYFSDLKYRKDLSEGTPQMSFDVVLNKPEDWEGLLNLKDIRFHNLSLSGVLDLPADSVLIDISVPDFHYQNVNFYRIDAHVSSLAGKATAGTTITAIDVNEEYFFDELSASIETSKEGFSWTLAADDLLEELNTLDLSGRFLIDSTKTFTLFLDPEVIEVLNQSWELRSGNRIRWGKGFVELKDIVFENGDQVIAMSDIRKRGIMVETQNFDFSIIDVLWDYENLDFNGPYTLRAGISDIYKMDTFYLTLDAPDLIVNGDSYGELRVEADMQKAGDPVALNLLLSKGRADVRATGTYYPPLEQVPEDKRNIADVHVVTDTFPILFLQYFLGDAVRNTTGYMNGRLDITGSLLDLKMDGDALINDAGITVSYLGTRYYFDHQKLKITERVIDATGATITDDYGNKATITGGLTHRAFGKMGLNTRIVSPRILAINTTRADNSIYYGKGVGSIDARFSGFVDRPTISVNAVTDEGTYMVINLAEYETGQGKSFIRFRNDEEVVTSSLENRTNITGMNFDMNLTATPDAVVEIKLEENPPESIVGNGSGNIRMAMTRSGDFSMYGEYEIESGDYLFRSFYIINKPFQLRRGGTIRWNGEPYNAEINMVADYSGLRASLSTLLLEYQANMSPGAWQEASRKTDVELKLLLTGTLLEPEINFDLSFPNLSGELAGYTNTKLRVLKSNQNALNEQVFGLLWAGSFLPSNVLQNSASTFAVQGAVNSFSEFISSQVSAQLSNVIARWVEDVDFISGIDFDVGYSKGSQIDVRNVDNLQGAYDEWEVRLQPKLLNDRVLIDAGANYGTGSVFGTSNYYFVGDYAIEYLLTRDGRLKIRFYYRTDPQSIEGRKSKYGVGLAWRREFDTFDEWLSGLKKDAKDVRKKDLDPDQ